MRDFVAPVWSPNSNTIALTAIESVGSEVRSTLVSLDAATGKRSSLIFDAEWAAPTWTPNSRFLYGTYFLYDTKSKSEISTRLTYTQWGGIGASDGGRYAVSVDSGSLYLSDWTNLSCRLFWFDKQPRVESGQKKREPGRSEYSVFEDAPQFSHNGKFLITMRDGWSVLGFVGGTPGGTSHEPHRP